jgi:hypothetical protein
MAPMLPSNVMGLISPFVSKNQARGIFKTERSFGPFGFHEAERSSAEV